MTKRDRAAYMRAYRAKRAKGEGVSAPPPIGELRDGDEISVRGKRAVLYLREGVVISGKTNVIQSMSQAERDRILRKLTK